MQVVMAVTPKVVGTGFGMARLDITGGQGSFRIWNKSDKSERFDHREDLDVAKTFTKDGTVYKRTIWIEGEVAHTGQRQARLKLTYMPVPEFFDEVTFTVLGLEKLEWKGLNNSVNDDDDLDKDINHGVPTNNIEGDPNAGLDRLAAYTPEGCRVFPGSRYVRGKPDGTLRNAVLLGATLSCDPVEPVSMYFRSYDLDDPTADPSIHPEVDNESTSEDNRGTVDGLKGGRFVGADENGIVDLEFKTKTEKLEFHVSLRPGDNYRVAGSADKKFLLDLHNDDQTLTGSGLVEVDRIRIVSRNVMDKKPATPKDAGVREPGKHLSPALSVWRKCYVEYDRMAPVEENYVVGKIFSVEPGFDSAHTTVMLNLNFREYLDSATVTGLENTFKEGQIEITGFGKFTVDFNTAQKDEFDSVIIKGVIPKAAEGATFLLKDDDFTDHGFDEGSEIPDLDFSKLDEYFQLAYIVFDLNTLKATNTATRPPFVANTKSDKSDYLRTLFRFNHKEYERDEFAWTIYVLAGFQGTTPEDGDPDGENCLCGIVDAVNGSGAILFIEGMNDFSGNDNNNVRMVSHIKGYGERDAIAHEIGHLFGVSHGDGGIIDQKSQHWTGLALNKIRSIAHP